MVVGEKPRCGSTKGATISPTRVSASAIRGRLIVMEAPRSLAARYAQEAIGA